MNRRHFFLLPVSSLVSQRREVTLQVSVMEAFLDPAGPSALLVHHATASGRSDFGSWFRSHNGDSIICTLPDSRRISARVFRLNGCFGRGLILARDIIDVRPKDIVTIN